MLVLTTAAFAFSQDTPIFQSGVNLVLLDVSVTDSKGVPVSGLTQSRFEIQENRKRKEIARFEYGSGNVSLVLVTDYSGSMRPRREALFRGVTALMSQFHPGDEPALIAFDESVQLLSPFQTVDQPLDWLSRLAARASSGQTALYDAISQANDLLSSSTQERRVIIVLTDGEDTASKLSVKETLDQIRSSNTLIYTIGLFKEGDPGTNASTLKNIAEMTGGEAVFDAEGLHLPEVFAAIMKDLRARYLLGFYAATPPLGKVEVRRLSVSVHDAEDHSLRAHTRREYRIGTPTRSKE